MCDRIVVKLLRGLLTWGAEVLGGQLDPMPRMKIVQMEPVVDRWVITLLTRPRK